MTGSTVPARSQERTNRRQQVQNAAAALFARRGFDGISMAEIAAEVGISAPALYRHFPSKESIIVAITLNEIDHLHDIVCRPRTENASLRGRLRQLVSEVLDHPDEFRVYLRERCMQPEGASKTVLDRERAVQRVLTSLIADCRADLEAHDIERRLIAMSGVLKAFSERRPSLARPSAESFVAGALDCMLLSEPITSSTPPPRPSGHWSPRTSQFERVLRAALALFRERGFDGVGFGEIGEAAGIGSANVARYFENRGQILVDLYDRVGSRVEVGVDDAMSAAKDASDALGRLIDSYCAIAFEAVDLVVVVSNSRGAIPPDERPRLRRRDRRIMSIWRAVVSEVRADLRPVEVRTLCIGIMPLVNMFPQQMHGRLPHPSTVASLVRAYLLGAPSPLGTPPHL